MITISILGLDQYVIGHYSKRHTENIAQIFETEENEINFYAPQSIIVHNGVEQTSWQTVVVVSAPEQYAILEDKVADYIIETLKEVTIHISIRFEYYSRDHAYDYVNEEYPRYIASDNIVDVEDPYAEMDEEEYDGPIPEPYLGNAFEGKEDELDAKYAADEEYIKDED
ncbi:MAG: hypothetical protein MJ220_00770 [Bacilli bacterium]|nr:hypothetical protein [Bacilli bacterium]